ncbi:MAG: hypothetical protein IPH44_15235 [Myxococcales bacterium]|nr:hypothetical protein [Myxococcales bacterium]MBK7193282.1 hypothetical protein [Myxococcales bacterium]MBP6842346.1 hypothetical protein [Kofleriaceae bacterium]
MTVDVGTGGGSIKSDIGDLDCGATCSAQVREGTVITLTATPASGSTFIGWRRDAATCGTESTCSLTVSGSPLRVGARFAQHGTAAWVAQFGGPGSERDIRVTRGRDGTSTAAFGYSDSITFDGTTFPHVGDLDLGLVHLSAAGDTLWTRTIAGAGPHYPAGIAVTQTGDVVLFGAYGSMTDFGGPGPLPFPAGDTKDFFVAKFAGTTGALLWQKAIHADDNDDPGVGDVTLDEAGDVYIAGAFNTSIDFGDGSIASTTPGDNEVFLAKLDGTDGAVVWLKRLGGPGSAIYAEDVVAARGDVLHVVGNFGASCNIGGSAMVPVGGRDGFIGTFSSVTGQYLRQRQLGGTGDDTVTAVAVDINGLTYLAMSSEAVAGGVSFAGQSLSGAGTGGETVVGALDSLNMVRWAQRFGGSGSDVPTRLATLADGSVALLGSFTSPTIAFGDTVLTNSGSMNTFLARLSPGTGATTWAAAIRSNLAETADSLAATGNSLTVGGGFSTQVNVLGAPLVGVGRSDAFAADVPLPPP